MEKILKQAAELYAAFAKDANSLELEKLMKEFRKASLAAAK